MPRLRRLGFGGEGELPQSCIHLLFCGVGFTLAALKRFAGEEAREYRGLLKGSASRPSLKLSGGGVGCVFPASLRVQQRVVECI